ncbi:MAG: hypothetical protein AABZ44_10335, partial [Elusimicrobiota bacterium]
GQTVNYKMSFWPTSIYDLAIAIFIILTFIMARKTSIVKWLGLPIILAVFIAFNLATLLHLHNLDPVHWHYYFTHPILTLCVAAAVYSAAQKIMPRMAPALLIALIFLHSGTLRAFWRPHHEVFFASYVKDMLSVLDRMDKDTTTGRGVILGSDIQLLRIYTRHFSFLGTCMMTVPTATPREELLKRLIIAYKIYGYPEDRIHGLFKPQFNLDLHSMVGEAHTRKIGPVPEMPANPETEFVEWLDPDIESEWIDFYRSIPEDIDEALAWTQTRYKLDWILLTPWYETAATRARLRSSKKLEKINESGKVILYRLLPKEANGGTELLRLDSTKLSTPPGP